MISWVLVGTTLQVARALGRHGVGLDLSEEYLHLARKRLELDKLEAWESWVDDEKEANTDNLPLFDNAQNITD